MKYLKIENSGLLPIELLYLMGGTTKDEDTYKIGQFGTGLKYSMAFLLRENIDFRIFIGDKEVCISTENVVVGDANFEVLHIDGRGTSITTKMGKDWKPWMIVREIYCNALDEGGEVVDLATELVGTKGKTTFYLQLVPDIKEVWDNFDSYFIHNIEPLYSSATFSVYPCSGHLQIYKQGVLIKEDKGEKSVFRYDVKNASINELREYTGYLNSDIARIIFQLPENLIEHFLNKVRGTYEEEVDYNVWGYNFSEAWLKAIGSAKICDYKTLEEAKIKDVRLEYDNIFAIPKNLHSKLTEKFPQISALRVAGSAGSFIPIEDYKLERKVNKGLAILEACGYYIESELTWSVGVFGSKKVAARVDIEDKHIMFSEYIRDLSLHDLCGIIVEENEHYRTGFADCTRDFQTHFINKYITLLFEKENVEL